MTKVLNALGELGAKLGQTVAVGIHAGLGLMVAHVTKTKLINANPPYLNRRTGTLIRSISASPRVAIRDRSVLGTFGSNLDYARMHEVGFVGRIARPAHTVPAHQVRAHSVRTHRVRPHSRTINGRTHQVKAHVVRGHVVTAHRVEAHQVRAHKANVRYRARHFLRDTVGEKGADAARMIRRAIIHLTRTGKVPSSSELLSGGA